MAYIKLALVALLAFGAIQCQSAAVVEPQDRELDILLAGQQVIEIIRNVVSAVEKGINDSKTSVDTLIQQLTPELGAVIKDLLKKALDSVRSEKERIEVVIKGFEGLLAAVKKIEVCSRPQAKDLEKALANLQGGLLQSVRATIKQNEEDLTNLKIGFERILKKFRTLYDTEITAITGCIKPGHSNTQNCVQTEIEKIQKAVVGLGADMLLFYGEAEEVLMAFAMEVFKNSDSVFKDFEKEVNPVFKKMSDCIANMK